MISKACVVGQYQTKLEELARQPDVELTVVVPPFWRDERGIVPLEHAHTQGYTLLVEPIVFNGRFHLHFYPTLPKILDRVRPHLVHIDEEPYNFATYHAMRAARRVRAKSLFFTWQNLLRRYPPPFRWTESYVLRHADYAIAGNAEAVDILRAKEYRGSLCVVPQFGVDPNIFQPSNSPTTQPPNHPTTQLLHIGYIGRLVKQKGVDVLLRAVAGMKGDWELRLLGSGPAKANLQSLARELGIQARVHFDAPRPSAEMPTYLQQLDVVVLPSQTRPNWKEQFGRVLIEAMACEVPVIGSTCGEIPNVIGDAGLVFPENDADALRTHIVALQHDPARRIELGKRGRARVLAHFTQARVAAETYAAYCDVVGKQVDK
jgi:glycosyltransferase involved in cell wall biosynthesis